MPSFIKEDDQSLAQKMNITHLPLSRMMMEINRKLSAGVEDEKLLDFVFDSLDLIIPYDRIGIAIVEGSGDQARLILKWVRSKIPVSHLTASFSASIKGSSLQRILDSNEPRVINDLIKYSAEHPESLSTKLVIKDGIRSNLTCPLRSENRPVGVVFFSSSLPNTYENEHVKTFLEIADELSMIVEHGRLKDNSAVFTDQKKNMKMLLHDLKSPLGTIQGFAKLSMGEPWFEKIDPEGKEVFQVFLRNSQYMFNLLNSLQELSALEGKFDPVLAEKVQLDSFAKEMSHFGKVLAEAKDIQFKSNLGPEIPQFAVFDRQKLQRALDNLFSNAVKYSQRGSQIRFSMIVEGRRLVFEICDQGIGIPQDELHLLFREFGKTSSRPTEGESSTGLGLAITKKIIEQHAGEISVVSRPDQGSCFSFWIPLQ